MGKSTTTKSSSKSVSKDTKQKKVAPKKVVKKESSSESSSDSSSDSDSSSSSSDSESEEEVKPKKKETAKKAAAKEESSDSESSDSSDSESEAEAKVEAKAESSDSDSSESASGSDSDSDSESDSESSSEASEGAKRKAESDVEMEDATETDVQETKKQKTEGELFSIFIGNLPFSAEGETLRELFASYGDIADARVATHADTGRSRGFGYVDFTDKDAQVKALAATGLEIDGREIRIDETTSTSRPRAAAPGGDKPASAPSKVLFIGNLSFNSTEDSIRGAFTECGEVVSVRVITDRDTGRMKGYGYIEFDTVESATSAMQWNNSDLDGRAIRLDYSAPRNNENGGGGRGGGRGGFGGRGGGRGGSRGGFGGNRGGANRRW
ncbi:hypothetical protein BX661DRAFT_186388 [Kickxella alabastrina]|uniref:uncharacterized protein n=1 Tax=Kickxella alabastrina TaxID=61397 RepID=UPI0022211358|nr:uncharacterized protein BX661DRAFT_186388 [Kickxella alabastrina]KAI7823754.1 hypothetical protein BX661DRAFT_186388 [Kickxella alabastrina]KAJ1940957.1 hypothetical protein GGF37_003760 [Kickxella alabastrina]